VLVIAGWEAFCRGFAIPSYLFPAPSQIASVFVSDAPAADEGPMVTLRVTLIALTAGGGDGLGGGVPVRAEPDDRA